MQEFIKEVHSMETEDILLILFDQLDLYSADEIDILKAELARRNHQQSDVCNHISNEINTIRKQALKKHLLTTGFTFEGYAIKKYISVISGQVVLGTGFLSDFTASFSDFFGVQSNKFADKLEAAKNAATEKMILKSYEYGGNAIIGVDFDYITFHGNMIGVVANGTSVVVEKEEV